MSDSARVRLYERVRVDFGDEEEIGKLWPRLERGGAHDETSPLWWCCKFNPAVRSVRLPPAIARERLPSSGGTVTELDNARKIEERDALPHRKQVVAGHAVPPAAATEAKKEEEEKKQPMDVSMDANLSAEELAEACEADDELGAKLKAAQSA